VYAEYRRWDEVHARPLRPAGVLHGNGRDAGRRLRVGYVSPDLRRHSASYFIEPLLAHHDKGEVEVFAYAQVAMEDAVSARFKGYVDHWCNTVGMSDEALAGRIRADGIDVLVDLAGHTVGNRLLVFARKPAPVQVSWLGYGYTTGLEAMDYLLADEVFAPPGCEALFSEEVVRLPLVAAYRPAEATGEGGPLPALRSGGVITLGSLSRAVRLNDRVIGAWAVILGRLPQARLVVNSGDFRSEGMQARLRERFAAHGIGAQRLEVGFDSPPWDVLRRIDISLDCFPHNSGTTLYESLYMGVPFVTLADRPSVGRLGAAILRGVGHPEWVAATPQEYVDKVVELAQDLEALALLRAGLRGQMQASALMDETGFARSVEAAYRTMWQRWCDAQVVV
jgi:protein O-GlcNAc transferase